MPKRRLRLVHLLVLDVNIVNRVDVKFSGSKGIGLVVLTEAAALSLGVTATTSHNGITVRTTFLVARSKCL
jgi:hypothetical protein